MYTVYMHISKTTGKKYIGITCQNPWTRRFNGNGSGYKNCVHFWNAINKYGWNDFDHVILETCETEKEAMRLERKYIKQFKSNDAAFGYNIKEGGEHQEYPEEICKRISDARKGKHRVQPDGSTINLQLKRSVLHKKGDLLLQSMQSMPGLLRVNITKPIHLLTHLQKKIMLRRVKLLASK